MQRYSPVTKVADTTAVLEAETLGYTLGDVEAKVLFCTLADTDNWTTIRMSLNLQS